MEQPLAALFYTPLRLFPSIEPHLTRIRLRLLLTNLTVLTIKTLNTLDFFDSISGATRNREPFGCSLLQSLELFIPVQHRACVRVNNLAGILFRCSGV